MPRYAKKIEHTNKNQKLNADIAEALGARIMEGKSIYPTPEEKEYTLDLPEGKTFVLKRPTMNAWFTKNMLIPGMNGKKFRDYIENKRNKFLVKQSRERQKKMIEDAEAGLAALLKMSTKGGRMIVRKEIKTDEGYMELGRTVTEHEGEDSRLIEAKTKGITYVLTKLVPEVYGDKVDVKNTMAFSLTDLRAAEEQEKRQLFQNEQGVFEALPDDTDDNSSTLDES